ncbi:unnamed protein product [Arabidopsis halleri]
MGDLLLLRVIGIVFALSSLVSSEELLVVGETKELLVTPSLVVKVNGSSRLKQDLNTLCERIRVHGFPRFKHVDKYAHSLKLMVHVLTGGNTSTTHVCFHRDLSLGIGMCPDDQWEKVSNGSWFQTMSLFDHKILDVRISSSSKVTMKVSTVEEWFMIRIVFLILGTLLLSSANSLSRSVAFYYTCVLTVGSILGVLVLLFQGLKRLPTGLGSSALFLYSSVVVVFFVLSLTPPTTIYPTVGLGGVCFRYVPELFHSMLILMELDEGIPESVALGLWLHLHFVGLCLGLFTVKRFVLDKDGSIDVSTSNFVSWSVWTSAAVLIFQSSMDHLLGGGALISIIVMTSMLKKSTRLMTFLGRVHEIMMNLLQGILDAAGQIVPVSICEYWRRFCEYTGNFSFEPQTEGRWEEGVLVYYRRGRVQKTFTSHQENISDAVMLENADNIIHQSREESLQPQRYSETLAEASASDPRDTTIQPSPTSSAQNPSVVDLRASQAFIPVVSFVNAITPKHIGAAIDASEHARMFTALAIALVVILSHLGFSSLGNIVSFRPVFLLLLTDATIVLGRFLLSHRGDSSTASGTVMSGQGIVDQVGNALETVMMMKKIMDALLMDFSLYAVILICGLLVTQSIFP